MQLSLPDYKSTKGVKQFMIDLSNPDKLKEWETMSSKSSWRITRIPSGEYQTEVRGKKKDYIITSVFVNLENAQTHVDYVVDFYQNLNNCAKGNGSVIVIDYGNE